MDRVTIIYDGECPFCSSYVKVLRLREAVGDVSIINARESHPILEEVKALRLNLDDGMAAKISGRWYHGSDCVYVLASLSSPSSFANKINAAVFRSPGMARLLYPSLRLGRNIALKLLGKGKLDNLD